FVIKFQGSTYPAVIPGKECYVFFIYSVRCGIGASTRTAEFFGFRIEGYPLKPSSPEYLNRPSCPRGHAADFIIPFSTGNNPISCQIILPVRYFLPNLD